LPPEEAQSDVGVASSVKRIVRRIEELPSPPAVATKALNLVLGGDIDFKVLAGLIGADQSLSFKVLKLANAAEQGYGRISSIEKAAVILGLSSLRNILLGVVIRDTLIDDPKQGDPYVTDIWKHSLSCAVTSQLLAEVLAPHLADRAYAAGMIHDCGKLALITVMPESYQKIMDRVGDGEANLLDLEDSILGVDHCVVGKWLARKWNMPEDLLDAAWLHHQPPEVLDELDTDRRLMKITALANRLVHEVEIEPGDPSLSKLRNAYRDSMGLTEEQIDTAKSRIGQRFAERAAAFDLENDAAKYYFEALTRARKRLIDMARDSESKGEALEKANRLLENVGRAGLALAEADSALEVFQTVADTLVELGCADGFIYHIDRSDLGIEGLRWDGKARSLVACRLDEGLRPVFDDSESAPSERLQDLIRDYPSRVPPLPLNENAPSCMCYADPFYILSMVGEWEFKGEIMFRPPGPESGLNRQETAGLTQLAGLASAALTRLELEARLEERAERLARAMRKIQQINLQLLQTERLASVGRLAAGAAHEINNPLAIIYARTQLLEFKEEDPDKKKNFNQIMEQIERISSILTNLMDFARPSPPEFESVSVNDIMEKTLSLIRGELEKKQMRVSTRFGSDLPPILGDPRQLEQVFLNLVINAEHAMEESGGVLTVSTRCLPDKGVCEVRIKDTGVGIAKENMDKIFDPFFSTKEEGKGTGLGLSTSYGIVQSHRGEIKISSTPNKGTTVTVSLPMDPAAAAENGEKAVAPAEAPVPVRDSVLVIDDEEHIREILVESLSDAGFTVETAKDGREGLKKLARKRYTLLILDIRMPLISGLNLLTRIRKLTKRMPVIVITGLAGQEEVRQAEELGAAKIVRKPFQIEKLMEDIRDVLGAGGGAKEGGE
jgi:signal transduction histidine kinase/HD-like signal output (HDOD) protein/CheY-like chemotaxis protein